MGKVLNFGLLWVRLACCFWATLLAFLQMQPLAGVVSRLVLRPQRFTAGPDLRGADDGPGRRRGSSNEFLSGKTGPAMDPYLCPNSPTRPIQDYQGPLVYAAIIGKPVAYDFGLLCLNVGLPWVIALLSWVTWLFWYTVFLRAAVPLATCSKPKYAELPKAPT